jgi:AcrR family transcriptional regulator
MISPKKGFLTGDVSDSINGSGERKPRADGIQSRRAILHAAAKLATTRGLEGLSIGELAKHIGMSKSGLYAHFKSKQELELATIDTATEIFEREVIARIPLAPGGFERIEALNEAFLDHLERRVFPGGCFFATVAAQLAPHPGPARDRVLKLQNMWQEQFLIALREEIKRGGLPAKADVDQLAFEITAMMFRANFAWIVTEDLKVLERCRAGVENVISRVAIKQNRRARRAGKK